VVVDAAGLAVVDVVAADAVERVALAVRAAAHLRRAAAPLQRSRRFAAASSAQ
jgi:hypothetical protein